MQISIASWLQVAVGSMTHNHIIKRNHIILIPWWTWSSWSSGISPNIRHSFFVLFYESSHLSKNSHRLISIGFNIRIWDVLGPTDPLLEAIFQSMRGRDFARLVVAPGEKARSRSCLAQITEVRSKKQLNQRYHPSESFWIFWNLRYTYN